MDQIQEAPTQTQTAKRIIIATLAIFSLLAVLLIFLGRHYRVVSQLSDPSLNQIMAEKSVDLKKLEADYRQNFTGIIQLYLTAADSVQDLTGGDFLAVTQNIQTEIMALRVAPSQKDLHLRSVLILNEIKQAIVGNDADMVLAQLNNLEDLLAEL